MNENRDRELSYPSDTEAVGELIRRAGPRAGADAILTAEDRLEAVRRWEAVVARRRRRLWTGRAAKVALALAAGAAFAVLGLRLFGVGLGAPQVATVERVVGGLTAGEGAAVASLAAGDPVRRVSTLETGESGAAALRLDSGALVRLDRGTRLAFTSPRRLELDRGRVFVDTSSAPAEEYVEVMTLLGTAQDIGTLYQVAAGESTMRVSVREGRVVVRAGDGRHEADAGIAITLDADGGVERQEIDLHGPPWSWIGAVAVPPEIEGETLRVYLDWLRRETGWSIRFAGGDRQRLLDTVLHGSLEGVAPEATPELVLPGCGLAYRLDDGVLLLRPEA